MALGKFADAGNNINNNLLTSTSDGIASGTPTNSAEVNGAIRQNSIITYGLADTLGIAEAPSSGTNNSLNYDDTYGNAKTKIENALNSKLYGMFGQPTSGSPLQGYNSNKTIEQRLTSLGFNVGSVTPNSDQQLYTDNTESTYIAPDGTSWTTKTENRLIKCGVFCMMNVIIRCNKISGVVVPRTDMQQFGNIIISTTGNITCNYPLIFGTVSRGGSNFYIGVPINTVLATIPEGFRPKNTAVLNDIKLIEMLGNEYATVYEIAVTLNGWYKLY